MQDPCINEFERKWIGADPRERGQILMAYIMYVKRRYDVVNFKAAIYQKTVALEQIVDTLCLKDFLPVSRAISYARKQIKELGNVYGAGLKRRPTGAELKTARGFKPITLNYRSDLEQADNSSDGDSDDLWLNSLDDV